MTELLRTPPAPTPPATCSGIKAGERDDGLGEREGFLEEAALLSVYSFLLSHPSNQVGLDFLLSVPSDQPDPCLSSLLCLISRFTYHPRWL